MSAALNITDVPSVRPEHLYMPMRHLIAQGRGLALLNGLTDSDLRNLDSEIWAGFADQPELRLASRTVWNVCGASIGASDGRLCG